MDVTEVGFGSRVDGVDASNRESFTFLDRAAGVQVFQIDRLSITVFHRGVVDVLVVAVDLDARTVSRGASTRGDGNSGLAHRRLDVTDHRQLHVVEHTVVRAVTKEVVREERCAGTVEVGRRHDAASVRLRYSEFIETLRAVQEVVGRIDQLTRRTDPVCKFLVDFGDVAFDLLRELRHFRIEDAVFEQFIDAQFALGRLELVADVLLLVDGDRARAGDDVLVNESRTVRNDELLRTPDGQRGANLFGAVAELVGEVLRRVLAVDKSVFEHEQHRFGRDLLVSLNWLAMIFLSWSRPTS